MSCGRGAVNMQAMETTYIVLLRAVNVGGRKVEMKRLREVCEAAGFEGARTFIQSGNIVLKSSKSAGKVEETIEALIRKEFGFDAPAIVRSAKDYAAILKHNPFPDADSKFLHLGLTKKPPNDDAVEKLAPRAVTGERMKLAGGALWIDFGANGVGNSKLMPNLLDKAVGSTLTARNWNSCQKLLAMAEEE